MMFNSKLDMMALSWKEPFATLMLHGKIETRTWHTNYRGYVLICASKKMYSVEEVTNISGEVQSERLWEIILKKPLATGHAIAIGDLVECRPMTPQDEDKCFVKYNPKLWCHVYGCVIPIEPVPWKGTQGWKKVPRDFYHKIKLL